MSVRSRGSHTCDLSFAVPLPSPLDATDLPGRSVSLIPFEGGGPGGKEGSLVVEVDMPNSAVLIERNVNPSSYVDPHSIHRGEGP